MAADDAGAMELVLLAMDEQGQQVESGDILEEDSLPVQLAGCRALRVTLPLPRTTRVLLHPTPSRPSDGNFGMRDLSVYEISSEPPLYRRGPIRPPRVRSNLTRPPSSSL